MVNTLQEELEKPEFGLIYANILAFTFRDCIKAPRTSINIGELRTQILTTGRQRSAINGNFNSKTTFSVTILEK